MSRNLKLMHPRNIYRTPPNFKQMAIDYPEFRKYAKQELSGKISIDFKDRNTLIALTTCLLERDFQLRVKIPNDKLVPTLPLRLNYILWIEDLVALLNYSEEHVINGIDIGTGASCIYALLAAKKNNWKILASEAEESSVKQAKENVERNNLEHMITIKHVGSSSILESLINKNESYDFTICNPPFFEKEEDLDSTKKARNPTRTAPRNAMTGSLNELTFEGGEVNFVKNIIRESKQIGTTIRIYSSMIGIKSSLNALKKELKELNVPSICITEFHQGHTTRWGLAWTFDPTLDLNKVTLKETSNKKNKPFHFNISLNKIAKDKMASLLISIFEDLKLKFRKLKDSHKLYSFELEAFENTWSNQRRKRRQDKKEQKETNFSEESKKRKNFDEIQSETKKIKLDIEPTIDKIEIVENPNSNIYIKVKLDITWTDTDNILELFYLEGSKGKDQAHQIMQFIKNKLIQKYE